MPEDIQPDRSEIYRYMGISTPYADPAVEHLTDDALRAVSSVVMPRYVIRDMSARIHGDCVTTPYSVIESRSLSEYLKDTNHVYAFAATLGSDVDRLIERDAILHPALAAAEQAVAAAWIEAYCDHVCQLLARSLLDSKRYLKSRFSPGYGDCSLESQSGLLMYLDAYRKIGLSLTDSFMMTPIKSVSAWIGVTDREQACSTGCAVCNKTDCSFRKEGLSKCKR